MKRILKIILSTLLILSFAIGMFVFARPATQPETIPGWRFPRLDEIWMIEGYPEAIAFQMALASDLDVVQDIKNPNNVNTLAGMGWGLGFDPGFHMSFLGINCRDFAPDTSDGTYHGRTPGFPLYPLNISQFRLALEYIVGCEKDAWIATIYEFICFRIDTTIPPASNYWYNPYITPYDENWAKAETLLLAGGFTWDYGTDATPHTTDDIWWMPNGDVLWNGTDSTTKRWAGDQGGIYVLNPGFFSPADATLSVQCIQKWNLFFTGVATNGVTSPGLFIDDPAILEIDLTLVPFDQRCHDIHFYEWKLGKDPDYLYDLFHPDVDFQGGKNSPGLINIPMDTLLWTVKYWKFKDWEILDYNVGDSPAGKVLPACTTYTWTYVLPTPAPILDVKVQRCTQEGGVYYDYLILGIDYTLASANSIHLLQAITLFPGEALEVNFEPCTYHRMITDINEMRDLVWLLQWKLYYESPYLPLYSLNFINAYKPGLESWVNSNGYGTSPETIVMPWTWASIHWSGQPIGGSVNWHVPGDVWTLNPVKARLQQEYKILYRMYDSLYVVNAYTHEDMPWAALDWRMIHWTSEDPYVPNGMYIKIWLRDDVYWQDGSHVTAEDVKWNFDFLQSIMAPEYESIVSTYIKSEVVNDYLIKIYVNKTGKWLQDEYLENALIFPRVIWGPFWGNYEDASAFEPWSISYQDWTGCPPTGPYPGLTCLYGTGPYILDYWDEVETAHLVRNPIYWVQVASENTAQMGGLFSQDQCYKKIFTYHIQVMENITVVDLNNPVGSNWVDVPPTVYVPAHIDDWVDNGDGVLSPSDQLLLYKNGPSYCETEWWHVDAVDPAGPIVTIVITEVEHIPKMTKAYIDIVIQNVNTKEECIYTWELWIDDSWVIDSGGGILDPLGYYSEKRYIEWYRDIAPCVHTWTLHITTIHGTDVYEIDMAYTIGDYNCDCKVDLQDIFAAIMAFGSEQGDSNWNEACDMNHDNKIDMRDIYLCILFYGIECHS